MIQMKKILQVSAILVATIFYAQKISDYQYIYVPETFTDKKANKYGLDDLLIKKLKQNKYTIIKESKLNWPAELANNPCQVLTVEVSDTSNMFKNKVKIDFKDCENKSLLSLDGTTYLKEFETGMQDALANAAKKIPTSMPVEMSFVTQKEEPKQIISKVESVKQEVAAVPEIKTAQIVSAPKTVATAESTAEIYSNGTMSLNRIFLSNGEFILVNPNNSVPFATFKPSTQKNIYRVQLSDGSATLGYFENGKIVIELANSDGSFQKEVFGKK
jgi:hypothetical protein